MKTNCYTIICLTALGLSAAFGQQPVAPVPALPPRPPAQAPASVGAGFSSRLNEIIARADGMPSAEPSLTKFNLDFPGGTPKELVAAIEKAMGRPLNAIVPKELADTSLPALKMNDVNVPMLFQALVVASTENVVVPNRGYIPGMAGGYGPGAPGGPYSTYQSSCGFRSGSGGNPSDNTIWYFYADKPATPPLTTSPVNNICRFYSLAPYLDRGLSVDDITTAIETGWKMLREISPPRISFHKETKLLIAVGEERKLETIVAVLKALEPQMGGGGFTMQLNTELLKPKTTAPTPAPAAKAAETPKSGQ